MASRAGRGPCPSLVLVAPRMAGMGPHPHGIVWTAWPVRTVRAVASAVEDVSSRKTASLVPRPPGNTALGPLLRAGPAPRRPCPQPPPPLHPCSTRAQQTGAQRQRALESGHGRPVGSLAALATCGPDSLTRLTRPPASMVFLVQPHRVADLPVRIQRWARNQSSRDHCGRSGTRWITVSIARSLRGCEAPRHTLKPRNTQYAVPSTVASSLVQTRALGSLEGGTSHSG